MHILGQLDALFSVFVYKLCRNMHKESTVDKKY